jgi:tRNA1(Val) A37 N6-methylase TrmN6
MYAPQAAPGHGEMLCSLSGHWMIYQLENGHRMTSDDLLIAYIVIQHYKDRPIPREYLDIGTGLGSVLNLVNWAFHGKLEKSVGIEAQKIHVDLARKTTAINGIDHITTIIHHDLRSLIDGSHDEDFPDTEKFGLITGTPPYFPAANGSLPVNVGRGMCAFELRGGIEVYCRMARRHLREEPSSRFIVTQTSLEIERTLEAARNEGFALVEEWDVHGIEGKPALFSVFVFMLDGFTHDADATVTSVYIRGRDGQFTPIMNQVFRATGKPAAKFEPLCIPKSLE